VGSPVFLCDRPWLSSFVLSLASFTPINSWTSQLTLIV
jgi:hypothetical protein